MSILKQHERKRVIDRLVGQMDNRRGSLLCVGAHLPEVASHALKQGLFVTVVEGDVERMNRFLEPLKAAGQDQSVSWDRRPYHAIEFLSSSYNYVVAWDGIPDGFPDPALFFKKVRRELKAGGTLYLRTRVRHSPADAFPAFKGAFEKLPEALRTRITQAAALLESRLLATDVPLVETVKLQAERFFNFESVENLSVTRLPKDVRGPGRFLPPQLFALFTRLDDLLSQSPSGKLLPSTALFTFAKTKEFGRVFMVK